MSRAIKIEPVTNGFILTTSYQGAIRQTVHNRPIDMIRQVLEDLELVEIHEAADVEIYVTHGDDLGKKRKL